MAFSKKPTQAINRVVGSPQQEAIWEALRTKEHHIVVKALAGTGKTFTMVEGMKRVRTSLRSCFVAFNKSIAVELESKVPSHAKACTLHSLGNSALRAAGFKPVLDGDKTDQIITSLCGKIPFHQKTALRKLVGYVKNTLAPTDLDTLKDLAFTLDLQDRLTDMSYAAVPLILEDCKAMTHKIDFDDMIWLPVVLGLPVPKFDLLMVDEAQDLNKTQQVLALSAGDRVCIVGDSFQAIYGFRGSDVNSIPNLEKELGLTDRGVESFPLTVSRRCPQSVTRLAQSIVPNFECLPDAIEGSFQTLPESKFTETVAVGDMVLCRVNAPLVSYAYRLLKAGTRAKIQGRDIGEGLRLLVARLAQKTGSQDIHDLLRELGEYEDLEELRIVSAYKFGIEGKLAILKDRCDCIRSLCEGFTTVGEVNDRIRFLFEDVDKESAKSVVLLSSMHKAKGLECKRVFILHPEKLPHPMAKQEWEIAQEYNLAYVAITRTQNALYFVHDEQGYLPPAFDNYEGPFDAESKQDDSDSEEEESEGALCKVREAQQEKKVPRVSGKAQQISKVATKSPQKGKTKSRTSKT